MKEKTVDEVTIHDLVLAVEEYKRTTQRYKDTEAALGIVRKTLERAEKDRDDAQSAMLAAEIKIKSTITKMKP